MGGFFFFTKPGRSNACGRLKTRRALERDVELALSRKLFPKLLDLPPRAHFYTRENVLEQTKGIVAVFVAQLLQ